VTLALPRPSDLLNAADLETFEVAWEWARATTCVTEESIHGPAHWKRVVRLALELARREGGDLLVAALFGACHDVARVHDGRDFEHGPRAAKQVHRTIATRLDLRDDQLNCLLEAVLRHTDGDVSRDPTLGACWDADRLDLVRIGFDVDLALLSTRTAGLVEVQEAAARLWARDRRIREKAGLPIYTIRQRKRRGRDGRGGKRR
jgi:uncharacterized protein